MRIFLTGWKGLIGSNLLKRLTDLKHEVHYDMHVFEIFKWDIVIHLAATTSISKEFNPLIYENNVVFAKKMLTTPYRTIYASSCSAKYNTNQYAATKIYNEWLGGKHGNAVGLRFHNVFGNPNSKGLIWFLNNQKDGSKINIRGAELYRDFIHVDDVVDDIIDWIYSDKCGVFDVGTATPMMTMDAVNAYMQISQKSFDITVSEPFDYEPKYMVSERMVPHLDFSTALMKTIYQ